MEWDLAKVAAAQREYEVQARHGPSGSVLTTDRLKFMFRFDDLDDALKAAGSKMSPRRAAHALVAADFLMHRTPRTRTGRCRCLTSAGHPKELHASLDDATDRALKMATEEGKTYTPYPCPVHAGWHVGTTRS